MPSLSSLSDPRSYHILTYGTLLGSTLFQTFINGPVAFTVREAKVSFVRLGTDSDKVLPRAQFSTLQTAIFPWFFSFQTALPIVLAATFPGEKLATVGNAVARQNAGPRGLSQGDNTWTALVPIAVMFGTSLLNLVLLGPATTKVMKQRKHQETRDGKKYYDPGPKSTEMERLNSSFGMLHGASSLSNVIGLAAMLYYGLTLAEKL